MNTLSLNGPWLLDIPGLGWQDLGATVPGDMYNDLLNDGMIDDPFWRDNETAALRLMENDFVYHRAFDVPEALLGCDQVLLRCEGLDTLADIEINGALVGRADNMHRTWEYDVKSLLHPGENAIRVTFASPTRFIREANAARFVEGSSDAMEGFPQMRKAHCMFGWDWGPRLPDCGIWRDIAIIGVDYARIRDVRIHQRHEGGRVALTIETHLTKYVEGDLRVGVTVTGPDGEAIIAAGESCEIVIERPRLWWPSGLGEQPLYGVCVTLSCEGAALDAWQGRIGLRTLSVCRDRDADGKGETFCHIVNGVKVFAMGADYIPEDNLLGRRSPRRTRRLLEDAQARQHELRARVGRRRLSRGLFLRPVRRAGPAGLAGLHVRLRRLLPDRRL